MRRTIQCYQDFIQCRPLLTDVGDDWSEKDYQCIQDQERRQFASKVAEKMWNLFFDIIKEDHFAEQVKKIRVKCNMPIRGYNPGLPNAVSKLFGQGNTNRHDVIPAVKKLCKKYGFDFKDWGYLFEEIIYFDNPVFLLADNPFDLSLIKVIDLNKANINQKAFGAGYPVALLLGPAVGRRDMNNFIGQNWKRIECMLDKYKNHPVMRANRIRSRPKKGRINDFIYSEYRKGTNRDAIRRLAREKFYYPISYTDVNDAIKVGKKRWSKK